MQHVITYARDNTGTVIPDATVTVYAGTVAGGVVATIYSDEAGLVAKLNPFQTSGDGKIEFWVPDTTAFALKVAKAGLATSEFEDVVPPGPFQGTSFRLSGNLEVPNATYTTVPWAVVAGSSGRQDAILHPTLPGLILFQASGSYLLMAVLQMPTPGVGNYTKLTRWGFVAGGGSNPEQNYQELQGGYCISNSHIMERNPGDVAELQVWQDSGVTMEVVNTVRTRLAVIRFA